MQRMTKHEFQELLDRYFNGIVSEQEKQLVENFYKKLQKKGEGWNSFSDEEKNDLRIEIYNSIQKKKLAPAKSDKPKTGKWMWRVAASVIVALGIGVAYHLQVRSPGSELKYITKSTSKGQKATILLNDGSVVRLNSLSSIKYPGTFPGTLREVELRGEAFFEVKKDTDRPFSVTSHDIQTTVLGTSFNVHAYDSSSVSVALVTGKVKVRSIAEASAFNTSEVYLSPGESALYDGKSGDIKIGPFDKKELIAWKDGIIYLSDASYERVFDQLANWYGVEFQFANEPAEKWEVSGEFKDMSLELVLNTIGYSKGFKFQVRDDIVTVKFEN